MVFEVAQDGLAAACGALVGFSLALTGGGGSILAVPLLLYVVGVRDVHLVIGTSALAVAVNAYANLLAHARAGHVRWREGAVFAAAGVAGAAAGSELGKWMDGQRLLALFALLMLVVAAWMLRPRVIAACGPVPRHVRTRLAVTGFGAGALSGFFGIGGGFLIVPGLMYAARMPILEAIGTSLLGVGTFGLTTAANYARSGLVDWALAAVFLAGGVVGGWCGVRTARYLASTRGALTAAFSAMIAGVAVYMLIHAALPAAAAAQR